MKGGEKMYSTQIVTIDSKNENYVILLRYLEEGKAIYNQSLYYVRNAFTAYSKLKEDKPLTEHEKEVIDFVNSNLGLKNNKYMGISKENGLIHKYLLQALMYHYGVSKDGKTILLDETVNSPKIYGYSILPAQSKNDMVFEASNSLSNFIKAIKSFKHNKSLFKGMPKIPNYIKPSQWKTLKIQSQSCYFKEIDNNYYLHTKDFDLKIRPYHNSEYLKFTTISKKNGKIYINLVYDIPNEVPLKDDNGRYLGIDLGVNNFAALSNNIGKPPMIIKGKELQDRNSWYNKQKAHYLSTYEHCQLKSHLVVNDDNYKKLRKKIETKNLDITSRRRENFLRDSFHKIAIFIINFALENDISKIVIGDNKYQKQNYDFGKDANKRFIQIPYDKFINILIDKGRRYGIEVIKTEESYTSQSSILDLDILPNISDLKKEVKQTENNNDFEIYLTSKGIAFLGKRLEENHYKIYQSKRYGKINADINGASNIIRKVFPTSFDNKDLSYLQGVVSTYYLKDYVSVKKKNKR